MPNITTNCKSRSLTCSIRFNRKLAPWVLMQLTKMSTPSWKASINTAADFKALVTAKTRLGLNENSGLEGALRGSVHAIETKLNELNEPKYLVTMLMMRRHEKDFMLRHDPKYGNDMKKRASELTAAFDQSELSPAVKDELKKNLAAYQRDFFAWMEGDLAVRAEQKAMSAAYAAIEPVIDRHASSKSMK